jgi:hypothetical protein
VKRVAIVQSNYIPWKGYFDMIAAVDEFILYDDVQYTRRDWRNRNRIKTPRGTEWLTVPVQAKGRYLQTVNETRIEGEEWARKHWASLRGNYARAACFAETAALLEPLYLGRTYARLAALNRALVESICGFLGISTRISSSSDYTLEEGRTERLAALCAQAGAGEYVSGPSARAYLEEGQFRARGVRVTWFDYAGYPEYPQLWGAFVHEVSIVDLLFNCGREAPRYMKHVRR